MTAHMSSKKEKGVIEEAPEEEELYKSKIRTNHPWESRTRYHGTRLRKRGDSSEKASKRVVMINAESH